MSDLAVNPVHLAAYDQALTALASVLPDCGGIVALIARITEALGSNPSLEDLHRAYVRVAAGGVL